MQLPTDRIEHTTAFVTPVMEHWLNPVGEVSKIIWEFVFHLPMTHNTEYNRSSDIKSVRFDVHFRASFLYHTPVMGTQLSAALSV